MPTTTINRVRKAIATAVGADRLARVADTDLLVQGGIISSLEIVMVGLEFEKEFAVAVPDSVLTIANFHSLETLTLLMDWLCNGVEAGGPTQAGHEHVGYKKLLDSLAGCYRRPLLLGLLILTWLILMDTFALPYLVERGPLAKSYAQFSDYGRRLYHSSGGWAPNDLQVAVRRHQIVKDRNPGAPAILFFGDSGTVGSWVRADDAPPAKVEEKIRATYPDARVHNFAFFMRSFVKDVMLMEALLEEASNELPVDAVIFTLSDAYFDAAFQKSLIDAVPYFSLNRGLLFRFADRGEPGASLKYKNLYKNLGDANRKHRGRFEEQILEQTSIYRYKSFLSFLTLHGRDPSGFWKQEYAIGDKPLFPARLPSPPADFKLHDTGLNAVSIDHELVALVSETLDFLTSRGVKVYIFLRPYAPLEWRDHAFFSGEMDIAELILDEGWDKKATVIDLRWSLYGNQFSDSLSHYTPEGSRILGDAIGNAVAATLPAALASAKGASR
jgi:acyl carrier protein